MKIDIIREDNQSEAKVLQVFYGSWSAEEMKFLPCLGLLM